MKIYNEPLRDTWGDITKRPVLDTTFLERTVANIMNDVRRNGDAAPRRAIWSHNEPVTILGALRNAYGRQEVDQAFNFLETSFSDCTSFEFELQAYDLVGDMAYTVGLEHTSVSMDGTARSYTLRATQVYRREVGEWKVAHRHADTVSD